MSETENTAESTVDNSVAQPAAEEKPKVRRTRTRKADAEDTSDSPKAEPEGAADKKPARRASRATKAKTGEEALAAAKETETREDATPAPKKTTRRKTVKVTEGETGTSAASEQAPTIDAPAEEKPKARRGRPRKTSETNGSEPVTTLSGGLDVEKNTASAAEASAPESSNAEAAAEQKPESKPEQKAEQKPAQPAQSASDAEAGASQSAAQEGRQGGKRRQQNQRQQQQQKKNDGGKGNNRRQRRQRHSGQDRREPVVPKTSMEELSKMKVAELRQKAEELEVNHKGLLKADLVAAVFEASMKKEGFVDVAGVLDIMSEGYGFLRTEGYLPSEHDVYVGLAMIRRNGLRKGDYVKGQVRPARENEKYAALQRIDSVNDVPVEELSRRPRFADLTPVYPDERLLMEHGRNAITARVIDLAAPIGKGQRGLIVSPPKAGKTTVLKDIAASISANNPEVHLMCLLVDERPEEVTDMERSIKGEVVSSTFDMPSENHIAVAEMVIERAKRLVENGRDVVILLDSITRLARAYNLAQPASGRILSGGVDSTALYPPKRFLGAARNIEHGGSLTILASALIDTGSKMDEVIFEEFKGTGNMELKLDRFLADRRIFPAIDPVSSGTRKEDLLLDPQEAPLIWAVRRILANMNNTERAMDMLIKSLKQTDTNQQFLLRTAKKAQGHRVDDNFEL
ncbi:MAG: transcription termination factor Rho [Eggerthellaceae bacterium]|nr:transcription termination factor Rho [Eggerthellaceae bacterium]